MFDFFLFFVSETLSLINFRETKGGVNEERRRRRQGLSWKFEMTCLNNLLIAGSSVDTYSVEGFS